MEMRLPRNLGLELVRATEAAALNAGRWMGLGKADEADREASRAIDDILNMVRMDGLVVMSEEGKLDHDLVLKKGQRVGTGDGTQVDVLVDPIDGRKQLAQGYPGAISVAAVAPRGSLWDAAPAIYMEKIIVDAQVAPYIVPECLDAPAAWTLALVARAKDVPVSSLSVFMLDRPRHADLVAEVRAAGAHVALRPDGDIAGALMVCKPHSGVDILMGTGGILEGLLAACAIKALDGAMLGRLNPQSEAERAGIKETGHEIGRIFSMDELATSDQIFFAATGITEGPLLSGVVYYGDRAETDSMILRSETKTRRRVLAEHLVGA